MPRFYEVFEFNNKVSQNSLTFHKIIINIKVTESLSAKPLLQVFLIDYMHNFFEIMKLIVDFFLSFQELISIYSLRRTEQSKIQPKYENQAI